MVRKITPIFDMVNERSYDVVSYTSHTNEGNLQIKIKAPFDIAELVIEYLVKKSGWRKDYAYHTKGDFCYFTQKAIR